MTFEKCTFYCIFLLCHQINNQSSYSWLVLDLAWLSYCRSYIFILTYLHQLYFHEFVFMHFSYEWKHQHQTMYSYICSIDRWLNIFSLYNMDTRSTLYKEIPLHLLSHENLYDLNIFLFQMIISLHVKKDLFFCLQWICTGNSLKSETQYILHW